MPRHSGNEIKAGAFILLAIALLCAGIYIVGDIGALLRPKKTHYFSFDNVEGLKVGDDVLYAGIKCGAVEAITFEECHEHMKVGEARTRVLVTVEVNGDVPITDKDKPKVSRGFTGNVYMDIVPYRTVSSDETPGKSLVTTPDNPLRGYHYPTIEELSEHAMLVFQKVQTQLENFSQTLKNIEQASARANEITGSVQKLIARNETHVDEILENANKTTDDARKTMGELREEAPELVRDARKSVASTRKRIDEEILPRITKMLDTLNEAAVDVRAASGDVRAASADARTVTGEAREVVVGNRPNLDGTIEQLRQAAARLNLAMEDIRRNPWKLLSRNIQADAYTQNIYDATMSFAEGARALSQASGNLEALMSRPETDQAAVKETSDKINQLVGEMAKLEQLLFEALRKRPK